MVEFASIVLTDLSILKVFAENLIHSQSRNKPFSVQVFDVQRSFEKEFHPL